MTEHGDVHEAEEREPELRERDGQRETSDRVELTSLVRRTRQTNQGRAS
jgi:hypothetical protein